MIRLPDNWLSIPLELIRDHIAAVETTAKELLTIRETSDEDIQRLGCRECEEIWWAHLSSSPICPDCFDKNGTTCRLVKL
jgi:hypothetical protein